MPRLIALEWDAREARIAIARTRGPEITLDQAFSIPLIPRDPGQTFADMKIGERIAEELAALKVGRGETLVAVGRASIELRQLSVPAVPDEELPDVIRFQALRQFTTIGEDWPLDFVPLENGESENVNVLAAAISPEMVDQIRETCQAGDLTPKRLILRPFAAASLLDRHDRGAQPPRLMVDLLADEADLTVLIGHQVALMRTVRLTAGEDGAQAKALLGEIRRTIASAQNQLSGHRIEKVILCGAGADQVTLKEVLESQLSYDVEVFDPFDGIHLGSDLQVRLPEHTGRFAPLLGILRDEAAGAAHAIDFLHPREKPQPVGQGRRGVLIGSLVAVAALAAVVLIWMQLAGMDDEIDQLTTESNQLKEKVELAEKHRTDLVAVDEFLASDIGWLDELRELSDRLPPSEDVIVTVLNMGTRPPAGGQILLDGLVRESQLVRDLQQSMRWDNREVHGTGTREEQRQPTYRWRFRETQYIEPGQPKEVAKPATEESTPEKPEAAASEEGTTQ